MTGALLVRDAELPGGVRADVRTAGGLITEIGPGLPRSGAEVLEARGAALLPGLHDHHLHLHATAAAGRSARCGPPEVTGPAALADALARARPDPHGWVRGTGYHERVAGDLDATALDRLHAGRPVRVQHRSGALWMVNSAGARALGLDASGHPGIERDGEHRATGRLWRADDWLRSRLPPDRPPGLDEVGARLARLGVTRVTDATPDLGPAALDAIGADLTAGVLPQRVCLLGAPLGWVPPDDPRAPAVGPYKIVIADSGPPDLDELVGRVRAARAAGRRVAVHCVTGEALALLIAALDIAGPRPGDRVEHAALVPAGAIARLRELGLRVVTQPGFLAERGDDYWRDVPAGDRDDLYRVRSLLDGGVPCALSSDAPYGPLDPWTVLAAAVHRRSPGGRVIGAAERLTAGAALTAYAGGRIEPGAPADLVLLRAPRAEALAALSAELVAATVVAGQVVWSRPG